MKFLIGLIIVFCCLFDNMSYSYEFKNKEIEYILSDATKDEKIFIDIAVDKCWRGKPKTFEYDLALKLLRNDENISFTDELYGISLSLWCIEGGLRTLTKNGQPIMGDYRQNRGFLSHGPLQLMLGRIQTCGGTAQDAQDILWASSCWHKEYLRVYNKYSTRLTKCSESEIVNVIEAYTSNFNRYSKSDKICKTKSAHIRLLHEIQEEFQLIQEYLYTQSNMEIIENAN